MKSVTSTDTATPLRRWLCKHNFHALRPVRMWQLAPGIPYWHVVCEYTDMRCKRCGKDSHGR